MQTITLTQPQQKHIHNIILQYSKTQPNYLKYNQCILLFLDRCIFNNKFTLITFHKIFSQIYHKKSHLFHKDNLSTEKSINKETFFIILHQIASFIFKPDPNFYRKFYNKFLSEQISVDKGQITHSRVMIADELTRKLLTEQSISTLAQYQQDIQRVFVAYILENYHSLNLKKKLLLNLREIVAQQKKWKYPSLIAFLRQSQTSPHLIAIEHIQDIVKMLVPSTNSKQHQYYIKHVLTQGFHKEVQKNQSTSHAGDPGILLFEFQFLLARMAWDAFPRELEHKSISNILERYFKQLPLRKTENIQQGLPPSKKKIVQRMDKYAQLINQKDTAMPTKQLESNMTPLEQMKARMYEEFFSEPSFCLNFPQAIASLSRELPKLPPPPVFQQECPGPFNKNNLITLGQQPPPEPVEKGEKEAKPQKKGGGGKKDEPPPREFKWADVPQIKISAQDYLKQMESKLNFEVKPLNDIQRGAIPVQSNPVLICEILFPPELPKVVVPLVQTANQALAVKNYVLALQDYNEAEKAWKKTSIQLDAQAQLFFQYSRGYVYLTSGLLQQAFISFNQCRGLTDTSKMPYNNPDRSLPFFGFGQLLYEMGEIEIAARCFLKARQIRETILGLEHVQTATVFNNLACCYLMLGRTHEALGYIQIAEVVLESQLGEHHERVMTAKSNLRKIQRVTFQHKPTYRKMWQVFEEDKFQKKKKKKAVKEGKKK